MDFTTFFQCAAKGIRPYGFQQRFAEASELPGLLKVPTGAGKTATAVLGWLWRLVSQKPNTPRRLAYCLPMRVLVEQSAREAKTWVTNLKLEIPIHVLMGGVESGEWYLHPEKPAILIGTQDMLLSRALNRGYSATRFHWPIDFALLNNDCLWVFDEPQLMGSGISTSAQLAGLRKTFAPFGSCQSVWMSATLEPAWLDTIDFKGKFPGSILELDEKDYDPTLPLHKRMTATKTLAPLGITATKDMKQVADAVLKKHEPGTQTLVIVNTVDRAKTLYAAIDKARKKTGTPKLLLIHSRFRAAEREALNQQLQNKDATTDRIIVATQVVEAGVDISARTLITELAPWASIVQRIGRCNRTGDDGPGQVFWIDLDEKIALPYAVEDLNFSRQCLGKLAGKDVSPKALDEFKRDEKIILPFEHQHVLRRRDLLDLFDTSPDLSGNDIDIQRFVRGDDKDIDVQVFWRDISVDGWESSPQRKELCNVPVGSIKAFLKKEKVEGLVWDHIEDTWEPIREPDRQIRPGLTILLSIKAGGYSELGWDPESKAIVVPFPPDQSNRRKEEGTSSDPNCAIGKPLTLDQHTTNVCTELDRLLIPLRSLLGEWPKTLETAARWHDIGKAHWVFAEAMQGLNGTPPAGQYWAKSGQRGKLTYRRKHFRHELVSALAALQQHLPFAVAYVIAAHHGRVRLAIRSLPGEDQPEDPEIPFALGVHHYCDTLPSIELGDGHAWKEERLDLTPMHLGGNRSWTGNALQLLNELGPFRLAYLETLLRAADVVASKKEANNA